MTRSTPDLAHMRREYIGEPLDESAFAADWPTQFAVWLADAVAAGLPEPNAMVLATADPAGRPSARTVLLKSYDEDGFVFFTNYQSRKGTELSTNPYASLVFPWFAMRRQICACGPVERVSRDETERYFATRARESQLAAWASPQSQVIRDRSVLDEAYAAAAARFPGTVPAPPHWGGWRVVPHTVEFWQGRQGRLHDRLRYRRNGSGWVLERLAP